MLANYAGKDIEVFAIMPLTSDEHSIAEKTIYYSGLLRKQGLKTFLVDRQERIRGVYNEESKADAARLRRDIRVLQTED